MKKYLLLALCVFSTLISFCQQKNLSDFISSAKNHSPLLKEYNNQAAILALDSAKIKAGLLPQISGSSSLYYAPTINGYGYDEVVTNGQLVNALIGVNQQIFYKNRIYTQLKAYQLSRDSVRNRMQLSVLDLEKSISTQYISTWGDQELLKLSKEILKSLQKQDTLLKKLTQSSVFKQTDYLAFKVELEQQLVNVSQNEAQFKSNLATLNYLSGVNDGFDYQLIKIDQSDVNDKDFDTSPFAKTYQLDSLRNLNAIAQLNLNYQPKLSVFADAGYNSSLPPQAYRNFGLSAGLNLNIPIYDGGLRKLGVQQIKLQQLTQNNYKEFYRNQYQQRRQLLLDMVKRYDDLIKKSNKQLAFSKTLVDANALQLKTGDVRMTDYLMSVTNYLNLRISILQNKINQQKTINELNYFTIP